MKTCAIIRHRDGKIQVDDDVIALEQALSVDLIHGPVHNRNFHPLTTIMRTPGADDDLVIGLLFSLGIIDKAVDVIAIEPCLRGQADSNAQERIGVHLAYNHAFLPLHFLEGLPRYSSCGVCASYQLPKVHENHGESEINLQATSAILTTMPNIMSSKQAMFNVTGGVHAAALFDVHGNMIDIFEDVGRHNALDKLIGHMLLTNRTLTSGILLLSSRGSFEIIQKAARARISIVAVMGAVSSMAVEAATLSGITLIGFLGKDRLNIYTHNERIVSSD